MIMKKFVVTVALGLHMMASSKTLTLLQSRCGVLRLLYTTSFRECDEPANTDLGCVQHFFTFVYCANNDNSDNVNVFDVLRKGLNDLADLCDVVEEKFTDARDQFNEEYPDDREKS